MVFRQGIDVPYTVSEVSKVFKKSLKLLDVRN